MGKICGTYGEMGNAYRILMGKTEKIKSLWKACGKMTEYRNGS